MEETVLESVHQTVAHVIRLTDVYAMPDGWDRTVAKVNHNLITSINKGII